jgi:hypothetical protein
MGWLIDNEKAVTPARRVIHESYKVIAQWLQLKGLNKPKADVLAMVNAWLSNENNGRWTMVVDNADDATILFQPWSGEINVQRPASAFVLGVFWV